MSQNNLQTIQSMSLDFYNNNIKTVNVKQLDAQTRYLKITCTEHGKSVKLNSETMIAFIRYKKPDGYYVLNDCDILEDGTLLLEFTQQMTVASGRGIADILILDRAKVTLIKNDEDGFVEFTIGLDANDDGNGNVTVFMSEESEDGTDVTINDIEDIYNTSLPILSTMTFHVNVLPTAIEHSEVASSYEYDALITGLENTLQLEDSIRNAEAIRVSNEETRKFNEGIRQSNEATRQTNEEIRETNEDVRKENEETRNSNEDIRKENEETRQTNEQTRETNETTRKSNESTRLTNEQTRESNEATRESNESTRQSNEQIREDNENARQTNEQTRKTNEATRITNEETRVANEQIRQSNETARVNAELQRETDVQALMDECNDKITEVATATQDANTATTNANHAAASANEAAALCESVIDKSGVVLTEDIQNNLTTTNEGYVLDAAQGKILSDLIASLQEQMNAMHNVYYGTEDPNTADPEGSKDGDVYMLIIEDTTSTETIGGE